MTKKPTTQKMKFSIKDFFSKFNQIHKKMWILSHLLNYKKIFVCSGLNNLSLLIYFQKKYIYIYIFFQCRYYFIMQYLFKLHSIIETIKIKRQINFFINFGR